MNYKPFHFAPVDQVHVLRKTPLQRAQQILQTFLSYLKWMRLKEKHKTENPVRRKSKGNENKKRCYEGAIMVLKRVIYVFTTAARHTSHFLCVDFVCFTAQNRWKPFGK